jgi:hypothetical protein
MAERKVVSSAELNVWLTGEIHSVAGCEQCELTWKYRLREPEKYGGCNWSSINLRFGEDTDRDAAVRAALEIEVRALKLFNLEDNATPTSRVSSDSLSPDMLRRMLYTPVFHLDTNLINARQLNEAVNQLEKWRADGIICIAMAGVAHVEAQAGKGTGALARQRKAATHLYTISDAGESKEDDTFTKVEKILWEQAKDDNQANDVAIVCEAIKYHAILVTNDGDSSSQKGGILGLRDALREQFGVEIYRPEEAVAFIRNKIAERDARNAEIAGMTGTPVPQWSGQD